MKQIVLDMGLASGPTLQNFFPGPNEDVCQHLRLWVGNELRSPVPTYLWGESGSGKTHLLRAVAQALQVQGTRVGWLDATMAEPKGFDASWQVVLFDDVQAYSAVQQHMAFNWFVNATAPVDGRQRWVLAAGDRPPSDLPLREVFRTRLGGAMCTSFMCWTSRSGEPSCANMPKTEAFSSRTRSWISS